MESLKRTRGRPRDTGKDDSALLAAVADHLAVQSSMRPMTAMGMVVDKLNLHNPSRESVVRRLKRKWDKQGIALLAAARQRLAEQQMRRAAEVTADYFERYQRVMRSPEVVAFVQKMETYAKLAEQFALSPKVAAFVKEMDEQTRKYREIAESLGYIPGLPKKYF